MFVIKYPHFMHQVILKENVNGFEISISFDDSSGRLPHLSRSDIRIFKSEEDVTDLCAKEVFGSDHIIITGDIENLIKVYEWCTHQL